MKRPELTPSDWLRVITNATITPREIAICEGCSVKKAKGIVQFLNGDKTKGKSCRTDDYLRKYRGTDRKTELRNIYPETRL